MQFPATSTVLLLALSLVAHAAPAANADAVSVPEAAPVANPLTDAQDDDIPDDDFVIVESTNAAGNPVSNVVAKGNCKAGKFYCATLYSGNKVVCKSCGIVTGNSAGKCVVSASCRHVKNSCQVVGGTPHCV